MGTIGQETGSGGFDKGAGTPRGGVSDADVDPDAGDEGDAGKTGPPGGPAKQDLADVLASIRQLVTAETAARVSKRNETSAGAESVLILTPEMQVAPPNEAQSGEVLTEGFEGKDLPRGAPILDEEALRAVINQIIREELQGELGDRISRNLRKLIRREIGAVLAEERAGTKKADA